MSETPEPCPSSERTWNRRQVLRTLGAAAGGTWAAGRPAWDSGAEASAGPGDPVGVHSDQIAAAEWISGLEFTPEERELMREDVQETLAGYAELRRVPLENGVSPALIFDPTRPPMPAPRPALPALPPRQGAPGSEEDVAFGTVHELAGWLASGALSSVELTRLYLARLERFDPELLCVIQSLPESALEAAARADQERARGTVTGPLHGIPWGAKDLLAVEGTMTTWGARPYADQIGSETATVAARLSQQRAPLLAKLSVGALAWGDVWYGGQTRNPWNREQGSSGSSAGPAAATAAGLVGFSIGTETWGSIVSPSTRCGVTGLRPTFGRVPRTGAMALSWTMDKIGPICRSVEDCAFVLAAIEGPDGRDGSVRGERSSVWPPRERRAVRVGFVPALFDEDRTEGIEDPAERAAAAAWQTNDRAVLDVLRRLGWDLVPVTLPGDLPIAPLSLILTAEATTAFDELTRSGRDDLLTRQERYAWPNVFRQGQLIPAVEYLRACRIRSLLLAAMERVFETVDVFVAPTFGGDLLLATNLTGHPALCLPNGFRDDGTPTSITFTGRLFGESDLVTVGQAYQEATTFHRERPPVGRSR